MGTVGRSHYSSGKRPGAKQEGKTDSEAIQPANMRSGIIAYHRIPPPNDKQRHTSQVQVTSGEDAKVTLTSRRRRQAGSRSSRTGEKAEEAKSKMEGLKATSTPATAYDQEKQVKNDLGKAPGPARRAQAETGTLRSGRQGIPGSVEDLEKKIPTHI